MSGSQFMANTAHPGCFGRAAICVLRQSGVFFSPFPSLLELGNSLVLGVKALFQSRNGLTRRKDLLVGAFQRIAPATSFLGFEGLLSFLLLQFTEFPGPRIDLDRKSTRLNS